MATADTLDERMRSVELNAIKATTESPLAADQGLLEAHRSAEETIAKIQEKYGRAGVQVDALSATIRPNGTAIRSEVTMTEAAAEMLFGDSAATQQWQLRAELVRFGKGRNQIVHTSFKASSRDDLIRQLGGNLAERLDPISLPAWVHEIIGLDAEGHSDAALDELFDQMDPLLSSKEFRKVDNIIAAMPVEGPSLTLMMGLLSVTRPPREHLPSRGRYFERVYRLCKAMRRDAEALLGGLR